LPLATVKWFDPVKGYGFLVPTDGSDDIFVPAKKLEAAKIASLKPGDTVQFSVGTRKGKVFADNLILVSSAPTQPARDPRSNTVPGNPASDDDEFEREWGLRRT
jgi:cold shock CspA family protein